jgi:hypothetical protein
MRSSFSPRRGTAINRQFATAHRRVRWQWAACLGLWLCLSAVAQAQVSKTLDEARALPPNDRLHTTEVGDVRITTAVPSGKETRAIFGINLYFTNIQPVWIQVENLGDSQLWFLPVGMDPEYYTPLETAFRGYLLGAARDKTAERDFMRQGMRLGIEPRGIRAGYVFTRVDEGTKSFNVDVISDDKEIFRMTFFVPVPGLRLDHYNVDFGSLYEEEEFRDVNLSELADELEAMPCCTTDKKAKGSGDPLNIVIIGDLKDVYYSFIRAGWDETETVYGGSAIKTVMSALAGSEYRYSPVSALYVFGRPQDMALQRARESIHERNHLRLWATSLRHKGKPVWIGQISRDIGVRFTWKTITTHKIDPDVDETREFLIEDLAYSQGIRQLGYVGGVGAASYDEPRGNLTGDPYFTDGRRIVMWISSEPIAIDEIRTVELKGPGTIIDPGISR